MIYDSLQNFEKYLPVHRQFIDVLRFLDSGRLSVLSDGKYEVNDQGSFVILETYETKDPSDCIIESHRKYIDVQVLLAGIEHVGVCHTSLCDDCGYDEDRDFKRLKGNPDLLAFHAGSFMIFFPDDAHMPKVRHGELPGTVKKAVFKVPV